MQTKTMPQGRKKGATYKKVKIKVIDPALCPHSADRPHYSKGRCRSCYEAHHLAESYDRAPTDQSYEQTALAKARHQRYAASEKGKAAAERAKLKRQAKAQAARKAKRLKKLDQA